MIEYCSNRETLNFNSSDEYLVNGFDQDNGYVNI